MTPLKGTTRTGLRTLKKSQTLSVPNGKPTLALEQNQKDNDPLFSRAKVEMPNTNKNDTKQLVARKQQRSSKLCKYEKNVELLCRTK